mmetsp:Transcript_43010/g.113339  ORF Transcript_43010/g.113339 Transcript_43010/m.113339 type:complete len:109 (+) Transcript_43010:717-1043(+)
MRMFGVILHSEDTVGVSRGVLLVSAGQGLHQALRGLIVDSDETILPGSHELAAVAKVIEAKDLIASFGDCVQAFPALHVPVVDLPIVFGVHRDEDALGLRVRRVRSPT